MRIGPKSAKTKKDAIGKLRKTQLITTFAPGAIADMPDYSVIWQLLIIGIMTAL